VDRHTKWEYDMAKAEGHRHHIHSRQVGLATTQSVDWLAPSIVLVRGLERRRADLELADERVLRLAVVVHCTEALQVQPYGGSAGP
jgi:hypothetical protein